MKINFLISTAFLLQQVLAQDDPCKFNYYHPSINDTTHKSIPTNFKHTLNCSWQLAGLNINSDPISKSQLKLSGYSLINYQLNHQSKAWRKQLELYDESGFLWITDSLFVPEKDLTRIKSSISCTSDKPIKLQLTSSIQTQKLKGYSPITDSLGINIPRQSSGFQSPGSFMLNGGLELQPGKLGTIELGLASGKVMWMLNKQLYSFQNSTELNGIPIDKQYKIEGGLNLQSKLEKSFGTRIRWEHTSTWFYPVSKDGYTDIQIRNAVFWKPNTMFQACLRTTYSYNETRFPPGTWTGELTLGYVFVKNP
jgi:hypothetical protein